MSIFLKEKMWRTMMLHQQQVAANLPVRRSSSEGVKELGYGG